MVKIIKNIFQLESFEYMMRSIFNLAKNFPSYNIVFKTHPNGTEKKTNYRSSN